MIDVKIWLMSVVVPAHTRPISPEWNTLVQSAHAQLEEQPQTLTTPDTIARNVLGAVDRLSDTELEDARFYGLGVVACQLARKLKEPETRALAVCTIGE